jgi:hypothetical protein
VPRRVGYRGSTTSETAMAVELSSVSIPTMAPFIGENPRSSSHGDQWRLPNSWDDFPAEGWLLKRDAVEYGRDKGQLRQRPPSAHRKGPLFVNHRHEPRRVPTSGGPAEGCGAGEMYDRRENPQYYPEVQRHQDPS